MILGRSECIFNLPAVSASAFTRKPKAAETAVGGTAIFEAETEKIDAKVRWQRGPDDITASEKYAITADGSKHSLTVRNVAEGDGGIYAVIAGTSKVKFELRVKQGICCTRDFLDACTKYIV